MNTTLEKERNIFRNSYLETKDVNIALQKLRELDCTIVDAVRVVKYELNISLKEADNVVLNSQAYSDFKSNSMAVRQEFWDFIESSQE